jgi:two-component system chemotaxis response regulator CheY
MARILIVDDSSFARNRLRIIFERAGHVIVGSAANGQQALSLFDELKPDVVTLDYLMAGKNGDEVLEDIMSHDPNARVIMVSGSGNHTIENRVLSAGAKLFVEKFNGQDEYLNAVDRVMKA